jgi:protein TonB
MLLLHLGALLGAWLWPGEQAGSPATQHTPAHPVVMLWRNASMAPLEAPAAPLARLAPAPRVVSTPPVQTTVVAPPAPPLQTPPMSSVSLAPAGAATEAPTPVVASTAGAAAAATAATAATAAATTPATAANPPPAAPALVQARADHQRCPSANHPPALRERGIEGLVQLRVLVDSQGQASQVQLLASSGWRMFDEAALAMARGCRFHPARQADRAVDSWVEFPVRFALQG